MPKAIPAFVISQIKEEYFTDLTSTYESLAKKYKVSRRTIASIGKEDCWPDQRPSIDRKIVALPPATSDRVPRRSFTKSSGLMDSIAVLEGAIDELSFSMMSGEVKARSKEGCAMAIARLLEVYRKYRPQSVSDVVAACIEIGITPEEFAKEFGRQWRERA